MSKIISIGTRDSELALWQAKTVQSQLEHLGHKTDLVPVKSTGDFVLDKPFTNLELQVFLPKHWILQCLMKILILLYIHLKDVPTVLPKGIVQAAVLKRGNVKDTLVFKNNEEFLSAKDAVIAQEVCDGAQWLNRYPTHTIGWLTRKCKFKTYKN